MLIKVRFQRGAAGKRFAAKHAPVASGAAGLAALVAVSCLMLALWRLTSDLGWTGEFVISAGLLSHWQVWMAITIAFGAIGVRLARYGGRAEAMQLASLPAAPEPQRESEPEPSDILGPRV